MSLGRRTGGSGNVDYQVRRDNNTWEDHRYRVWATAAAIAPVAPKRILDPACGDGSIVDAMSKMFDVSYVLFGDISKPNVDFLNGQPFSATKYHYHAICQTVEETLSGPEKYDLVVLTEILEHVEDPLNLVSLAHNKATHLVASSPLIPEGLSDSNEEHVWAFDTTEYRNLLVKGGWHIDTSTVLGFPGNGSYYTFQIWTAHA